MSENQINEESELLLEQSNDINYSKFQPQKQFIMLCAFSFGLYPFFWFYKNWLYLKDEIKLDISPQIRIMFIPFYGISLFSEFHTLAKENGYTKRPLYEIYFVLYIAVILFSKLEVNGFTLLIAFFAFLLLLPMHKMMNYYYLKISIGKEIRSKITKDEKLFLIIIWTFLCFILIFGTHN